MRNTHSFLIVLAIIAACCFARAVGQGPEDSYTAPIVWTAYKVPGQNLTFVMPKLPVVQSAGDVCSETEGSVYRAYAREAVYEFEWRAKSGHPVPKTCHTKRNFSKRLFEERVEQLKQRESFTESEAKVFGSQAKMLTWTAANVITTRWLLWDIDRWLELSIIRRTDAVVDEERFLKGLGLAGANAVEIGAGAVQTLGDSDLAGQASVDGENAEGLTILAKPRPGYTDEARQSSVQGTVVLQVTFLANGGIGAVTPVKTLPHGMTENTVAAVRRISFLPARVNGKPVDTVRQVEYRFSIY